jgi:hypothetical protein
MKTILLALVLTFSLTVELISQTTDLPNFSRLEIENTAQVLPGYYVGIQGGMSTFTVSNEIYRFRGFVGIGGFAELEYSNLGGLQTMFYEFKRQTTFGLKVRFMNEGEEIPAIALSLEGTSTWQSESGGYEGVQDTRPNLYRAGLQVARYEFQFYKAQIVLTKHLWNDVMLNFGIGVENVMTRNIYLFGGAPNYIFPGYYSQTAKQDHPLIQGLFGIVYTITPHVSLMFEGATVPFLTPDENLSSFVTERAFTGSIGMRWVVNRYISIDESWFGISNYDGYQASELRIGINVSSQLLE